MDNRAVGLSVQKKLLLIPFLNAWIIATLSLINSSYLLEKGEGFRFQSLPILEPIPKGLLLGVMFSIYLWAFWFSLHVINLYAVVIGLYLCKLAFDWDPNDEAEFQTRYFANIVIRLTIFGLLFTMYVFLLQLFNLAYVLRLILIGLYFITLLLSVSLVDFQKKRGIV